MFYAYENHENSPLDVEILSIKLYLENSWNARVKKRSVYLPITINYKDVEILREKGEWSLTGTETVITQYTYI